MAQWHSIPIYSLTAPDTLYAISGRDRRNAEDEETGIFISVKKDYDIP
jgi:hypothetical protein